MRKAKLKPGDVVAYFDPDGLFVTWLVLSRRKVGLVTCFTLDAHGHSVWNNANMIEVDLYEDALLRDGDIIRVG